MCRGPQASISRRSTTFSSASSISWESTCCLFPMNYYARQIKVATKANRRNTATQEKPVTEQRLILTFGRVLRPLNLSATVVHPIPCPGRFVLCLNRITKAKLPTLPSAPRTSMSFYPYELLWSSLKLWQVYSRGTVVKCSDDLLAEVIL